MREKKSNEQTVYRALGLAGLLGGGSPCAVDVKDGKIMRVRPLHYDSKYTREELKPWKLRKNGKTLKAPMKSMPSPLSIAYYKRTYSPNRIKYPLKRVDWDPDGERHTENRGKSKYRRISWNEAASIIASEIRRVHKQYGPFAILAQCDGHGECKTIHAPHGCQTLLLDKMGGYTHQVRNADSWEGWYWGSKHIWGDGYVGLMAPAKNLIKDVTENSVMILFWGCDPETTPWTMGQFTSLLCYFWSEIGIKQVYICPDLNYGAAIHADKWIPVLPNTDAALQLAIIYTWIVEGTYDKEYVATHTVGYDKFKDYVLGKEDGIPKTPAWASRKCSVPEWTIKALAREFASKATSIAHCFGGSMVRGPYAHEPARLECILLAMQGMGRPGVHQVQIVSQMSAPRSSMSRSAQLSVDGGFFGCAQDDHIRMPHSVTHLTYAKQHIPKTLIQKAILDPPITYWGTGAITASVEDQFVKYFYPIPEKEGGTEIHMIWTDTPCHTTCWNNGNKTIEAYRSPKIECVVAQHPWLENDCLIADIILPTNTTFEVQDIVPNMRGAELACITLQEQAIAPIGESKSDYEAVLEVARKLGRYEEVTWGKTVDEWIKKVYKGLELPGLIKWKDFKEKGYFVYPPAPDWEKDTPGLRKFYINPEASPLRTPSGKLELYSERLARNFPGDEERSPIPKWIEKGRTHDESLSSDRAKKYPLLLMSNHGRWRVHAQADDISWTREIPTMKVTGFDGYKYEPLWLHPSEASKRGIKSNDIVRIYNERGSVLGGAFLTERIIPGVVYMDHGSRCDWIIPGELDRGGAINLISPVGTTSINAIGQATSGYLVEVEIVPAGQMEEWRMQYPEAFQREYDWASGLRFNAWVEE